MLSFRWPPLEEVLSILNVGVPCLKRKTIFETEFIKTKETAINAES
jgi:hypothetical protein